MTHPLDVVPQGVTLHYLLRLVPIDDGLEAVKGPTAHDVAHAFLLDAEPLYLVVDVEEQRVVTRGVVRRTDEVAAGASCNSSLSMQ